MNTIERIWKDPVWSKVISVAILGILSAIPLKIWWPSIINFLGNKIVLRAWVLLFLILIIIVESLFHILHIIKMTAKKKKNESKELAQLKAEYLSKDSNIFFDVDAFTKKLKILDKHEICSIIEMILAKNKIDNTDIKTCSNAIDWQRNVIKKRYINKLAKIVILNDNSYLLSAFIQFVTKDNLKYISIKNKSYIWEKVVSILKRLEYNSTNDMVIAIRNSASKIPTRFKKEIYKCLLYVSKSNAYQKETARTIYMEAPAIVYSELFLFSSKESFIDQYYEYRKIIIQALRSRKNLFMRLLLLKIEYYLK